MRAKRTASNAVANITNGASNAAFQIGMTALVARAGSTGDLALWSLVASLSGFAPLMSCNVSAAVARRLIAAGTDLSRAAAVVRAGSVLAARLTAGGLGLAVAVGAGLPWLYPTLAGAQPWAASLLAAAVFAGSCWVIAAQTGQGRWMALQRNWPIALAGLFGRGLALVGGTLLLVLAQAPAWAALALAGALLWGGYWAMHRQLPAAAPAPVEATRDEATSLTSVVKGFAVWSLTSAATQAAIVPIVAAVAPEKATPFYLAFTLASLVSGLAVAAANALAAPVAQLLCRPDPEGAAKACLKATYLLTASVNGCFVVLLIALGPLVSLWVGQEAAAVAEVRHSLALLALQQGLRSAAIASSILLAMGSPGPLMMKAALIESVGMIVLALPMAWVWGPVGLMSGLSLAAVLGALGVAHFAANQLLDTETHVSRLVSRIALLQFAIAAVWVPAIAITARAL